MVHYVQAVVLMLFQAAQPSPAPATAASPAPQARPEVAAEIERGVSAYNAQDLSYYEAALAPDVVYIADDGAVFAGKQRVVGLFTRIFARTPKPQLQVSDIVTGGRGDVAWARFNWTLSGIERSRPGVATALLAKDGERWQVLSIQNTAKGHAMRVSPAPGASPSPSPSPHQH